MDDETKQSKFELLREKAALSARIESLTGGAESAGSRLKGKAEELGLIVTEKSGWTGAQAKLSSMLELSAGTVGLLTWTSAFNAMFNAYLLNKINDLNKNMIISNDMKMISKWRADELFLTSYIEKGFKIIMPVEQQFYTGHLFQNSLLDISALSDGFDEQIFICRGTYNLDTPISLDKTRKIIAEPGTEIIINAKSCEDYIFVETEKIFEYKIENVTIIIDYPIKPRTEAISYFQRWTTGSSWEPNVAEFKEQISFKNSILFVPCYKHWLHGFSAIVTSGIMWCGLKYLKNRRIQAPKLMLMALLSTGAIFGSAFGNYNLSNRRHCYEFENDNLIRRLTKKQ